MNVMRADMDPDKLRAYIKNALRTWATINAPKILNIYGAQNGWEIWAQVEIAYHLRLTFPNNPVRREVQCYAAGPQFADFVVYDSVDRERPLHVIELKCEAGNVTMPAFNRMAVQDLDKLVMGNLDAGFKDRAMRWVVALTHRDTKINSNWQREGIVQYRTFA